MVSLCLKKLKRTFLLSLVVRSLTLPAKNGCWLISQTCPWKNTKRVLKSACKKDTMDPLNFFSPFEQHPHIMAMMGSAKDFDKTKPSSSKVLTKDLALMQKLIHLRVNTWVVLGPGCCMDYHASAGEHSLQHLVQISEDLHSKSSWIPSLQQRYSPFSLSLFLKEISEKLLSETLNDREISKIALSTNRQNQHQRAQQYLLNFTVEPRIQMAMHEQVMLFHVRLADLLEELSPEALLELQNPSNRIRDVVESWQQAIVGRNLLLVSGQKGKV